MFLKMSMTNYMKDTFSVILFPFLFICFVDVKCLENVFTKESTEKWKLLLQPSLLKLLLQVS